MQALKGRAVLVKRGLSPIQTLLGVRTKSLTVNGSPIDITTDDDAGIRKLMEEPGELSVTITVAGRADDAVLRAESLSTTDRVKPTEFTYGATEKFAGDFFLASYSESGEHTGPLTFEATFESAGSVTYTPPA